MRYLIYIVVLLFVSILNIKCTKEDPIHQILIYQPNSVDKNLNDVLQIKVEFQSFTFPVEHINVKIMNVARTITVYDQPWDPHVSGGVFTYIYEDQFALSTANGITPGDWVLEARTNREEDSKDAVRKSIEFHILQ